MDGNSISFILFQKKESKHVFFFLFLWHNIETWRTPSCIYYDDRKDDTQMKKLYRHEITDVLCETVLLHERCCC